MRKMNAARGITGFFIVAAFFLMSSVTASAAEYVSVAKDGVNLRSGPETKYSVLYELPQGYPLKVEKRKGQWLKVSDFENDQGWIYEPLVSKDEYVIVTIRQGNVRADATTNSDKVGEVIREVILKKVGSKGDWYKIEHPRLNGWIHKKLVWPR